MFALDDEQDNAHASCGLHLCSVALLCLHAVQVIDTGSVLLESACSVDRVHEALAATLPLVPGCQYYRWAAALAANNCMCWWLSSFM